MKTNNKIKLIILFIVLAIIYFDAFQEPKQQLTVEENGSIETYFCYYEDCEHALIKIINNSETLKCAFYDVTSKELIKILKNKNAEIITHNQEEFEKINTKGLMHHKFCVINQTHITTGSYNPTEINNHHENLIIIESKTLAQNYESEFNQIKKQNKDSKYKKEKTHITKIKFNDYELENYFCPQDDCKEKIIQNIKQSNETIYFLLFTFTDKDIAQELIRKKEQGIEVKGIIENFQNKQYWVTPLLEENNVTVKIFSKRELQHNKVFIIDNKVITGSYNPTQAATTINDENILIITQPDIVEQYKNYFSDFFESLD
jgi:phosphatidylserine/phosphatidylglycerophosphate/cardiolipin synthase-like enzyme